MQNRDGHAPEPEPIIRDGRKADKRMGPSRFHARVGRPWPTLPRWGILVSGADSAAVRASCVHWCASVLLSVSFSFSLSPTMTDDTCSDGSADAVTSRRTGAVLRRLPVGIWAMGMASMFMDVSSELIHALLPMFMVGTLGASMVTVGVIEGVAEATAAVMKVFSGALSDYFGRRKGLMVFGYGLAALSKPVFALTHSIGLVFTARFVDRIGKGIRGAPRDALVADMTAPEERGAAYGLRQALDSLGALLGPLAAMGLLMWWTHDVRTAMWWAVLPALLAVALLVVGVREPAAETRPHRSAGIPLRRSSIAQLPLAFWMVVLLGAIFTLARFSEAFLVLRAQGMGLPEAEVPVVMVIMNVMYAGCAYPAGAAADRCASSLLLGAGLVTLVLADVVLALAPGRTLLWVGAALWGLHMALTQGLLSKMVADTAPPALLGTGFGLFNLVSGAALLVASTLAGALWQHFGAPATFWTGAGFATLALLALPWAAAACRAPARHQQ